MNPPGHDPTLRTRRRVRTWLAGELNEERLIALGQAITGLRDGLDADFREALRILIRLFLEEARLNEVGLLRVHSRLLRAITNRLRIERDLRAYPEIRSVPIERPVFIVGLPRTGTTLLHHLLARDPSARAPALWELECPSPPPDPATRETDPRIAATDAWLKKLFADAPTLPELHPLASRAPEECHWLLQNSLRSGTFPFEFHIPSYTGSKPQAQLSGCLAREKMVPALDFYRAQLQLLTWRCRGDRLVLKDPFHHLCVDLLLARFPDARVIHLHRDPLKVLPSLTRLCATVRSLASDDVSLPRIAAQWAEDLPSMVQHVLTARATRPDRFHDVYYADLVRDPVGEARRIHDRFGIAWSGDVEARMQRWLHESGHRERRTRQYDELSQLGLCRETVQRRFAAYCEQFQVPEE